MWNTTHLKNRVLSFEFQNKWEWALLPGMFTDTRNFFIVSEAPQYNSANPNPNSNRTGQKKNTIQIYKINNVQNIKNTHCKKKDLSYVVFLSCF